MSLEIDSDLRFRVRNDGCSPIIFVPEVDLLDAKEESIINGF